MATNPDTGIVELFGKDYQTVAYRVHKFREEHPNRTIETQMIFQDEEKVIMKALIMDGENIISTGYAEEVRNSSDVNSTSCMENAETSAVGRALAFYGLAGSEIRSADEMTEALIQRGRQEQIEYMELVREHWDSIADCKQFLIPRHGPDGHQHNVTAARECMKELGDEVYTTLWRAPSKGGCFTTLERKLLKEPPEDSL